MSRTPRPQEAPQAAAALGDRRQHEGTFHQVVSSPRLPSESNKKEKKVTAEVEMTTERTRNPKLDRFLQFRARLEFAELMTRRQAVEEEVGEDEELEREVGGGGRNVGRSCDLWGSRGWVCGGGKGGGGGGPMNGDGGDGGGDGDGIGSRKGSGDFALSPPQLEHRSRGLYGGGVGTSAQGEMDGLSRRMRKLTGEMREVRKVVEEKREQEEEEEPRSRLVSGGEEGNGARLSGTYFPSSPILSSLYPAKERWKAASRPGSLDPE